MGFSSRGWPKIPAGDGTPAGWMKGSRSAGGSRDGSPSAFNRSVRPPFALGTGGSSPVGVQVSRHPGRGCSGARRGRWDMAGLRASSAEKSRPATGAAVASLDQHLSGSIRRSALGADAQHVLVGGGVVDHRARLDVCRPAFRMTASMSSSVTSRSMDARGHESPFRKGGMPHAGTHVPRGVGRKRNVGQVRLTSRCSSASGRQ